MKIEKYAVFARNETKNVTGFISDNTISNTSHLNLIYILPEQVLENKKLIDSVVSFFSKRKATDFMKDLRSSIEKDGSKDVISLEIRTIQI